MRKGMRVGMMSIIGGLILCACGALAAGASSGGFAMNSHYERKNYTAVNDVTAITVYAQDVSVTVRSAAQSSVTLEYSQADDDLYEVTEENGVLTLTSVNRRDNKSTSWHLFSSVNKEGVIVTVPEGYQNAISLDTTNGSLNVQNVALSQNLKLKTSNSSVKLTDVRALFVDIATSNGSVNLDGVDTYNGIQLQTSNASVRMDTVRSTGDVYAKTSNGSMTLGYITCTKKITAQTGNGSVTVAELRADDISLRTSNARVSGTIVGNESDYAIVSETSNGSNSLPSATAGAGKALYVHTSNGSVAISFVPENN